MIFEKKKMSPGLGDSHFGLPHVLRKQFVLDAALLTSHAETFFRGAQIIYEINQIKGQILASI